MIIYLIWAIILSVHRRAVIGDPIPDDGGNQGVFKGNDQNEVVNPRMGGDYEEDQAEL